ncbi:MAG: hypothetical protein D3914_17515, partial [Candidatus Electrothrix sp. LOE2]|nr:hypothetical protein [Candidatus Electrothrix sp. LOE2]
LTKTAIYEVRVDTDTLPNGGIGLSNSVDPESDADSRSIVDLDADADGIVLDRDFGYTADIPNTISGTIWNDSNADGTLTDGASGTTDETGNGVADVTVVLRDSKGNIVATTKTNGFGNYSFDKLPDGTYTVDVVDTSGILDGFWHSVGPNAGVDNNSQSDPYTVTVDGTAGRTNTTADFGYYKEPASVGDLVWNDLDGDGLYDPDGADGVPNNSDDEKGLPNVEVTATVTYDNGATVTITTKTDSDGKYSFGNLLLDEDYAASATGGGTEPRILITVTSPTGMISTHTSATDLAEADNQADDPTNEPAEVVQGGSDFTNDFGYRYNGSIGDTVYLDDGAGAGGVANDGLQNGTEAGIADVTVTLTEAGPD